MQLVTRYIPVIFVLIWSTGFIVARYGMPYSEPITFMFLRFTGVLVVLLPFTLVWRITWPNTHTALHIAIAGCLLQAGYLVGVWAAVKLGMSASLVALIMGLQPIITACLSALVAEKVSTKQWVGLLAGVAGVGLVLFERFTISGLSVASLSLAIFALASITTGTLYQKRFCPRFDLRGGAIIQFSASALLCLPLMFVFETREVDWQLPMIGALLWSILALSVGATMLLFMMIRDGAATKVTSLLYLTPPTTALMAWFLFDERISSVTIAGILLTVVAVWMVSSGFGQKMRVA